MPPALPIELWLVVFRWATISEATRLLFAVAYHPFNTGLSGYIDREVIVVKHTISSVCKLWRHASTSLLLEDVVINNNIDRLTLALKRHANFGHHSVRRACLPYTSCLSYKSDINQATALLAALSRLEVLVRPPLSWAEDLRFDFPAEDCPRLLSLKRLDWWHHDDASKTGGLNSLTDVLRVTPNLEYLSIWGDSWISLLHHPPITLAALTTLRIRPMNVPLLLPLHKWKMPRLTHIIVDSYNGSLSGNFWSTVGSQVDTVELGPSVKFGLVDMIQYVLGACPNLRELNYHIQFAAIPCLSKEHGALTTVRLHAAENGLFADEGNGFWEHIEGHLAALSSACFPALKHVILHGDWTQILNNEQFKDIMQQVLDAGRCLEFSK